MAVLLAAAALPARAGPDRRLLSQCIRERWTYRDGLPHNGVHRLLVARSGYLWIGTQEGLVRFDGVRFALFARPDTPGMAGNEISALVEDDRGVLWVGTTTGLSRLVGDAFQEVGLGGGEAVVSLADDGQGGVYVATETSSLWHVRAGWPAKVERVEGLGPQRLITLLRSGTTLWVGGELGLARLVDGRLEVLGAHGLPAESVTSLEEAQDGTLWVGTARGLARRRAGGAGFEQVPLPGSPVVYALLADRGQAMWVGTGGGTVFRVVGDEVQALTGSTSPADVHALAEDGEGDVWAGTESGGLYRLRWGQAVTIAREEGLSDDVVWAVREGRGGVMWLAGGAGLDRLADGRVEPAHADALRGVSLAGLLEDRHGVLWVGTEGAGLWRFGPGGATRYGAESGLRGTMVRVVHEDSRGTIWVGTTHGVFRMAAGRFQALESDPGVAGKVNTIEELPGGGLWVGTTSGLRRVEGERLVPESLAGQPIRGDVAALRAEPDGTVWIGTAGDGLARFSGGRLERWTRREGLHEDVVLAILDDGAGHLWLSGNHGISRVDRAELEDVAAGRRARVAPTVFGTADGMRERECNGGAEPSAWRGADGRLWFPTVRGVVVIDPAHLDAPLPPPAARVEELVVDGRTWPPSQPMRFPAGTRRVDVRYTGLALAAADRVRFRHRLAGLDDGFLDAGSDRVAHFTNLGPGRYTFEVAAASASGAFGPPASVLFSVEPHLWQTGWFLAAAALAALALVVGVYRARTSALRRREAVLAVRVEEEIRKVKILTGLLPTCAWCKRIRDEHGNWQVFEAYVSAHADVQFSHGICPECLARSGQIGEQR